MKEKSTSRCTFVRHEKGESNSRRDRQRRDANQIREKSKREEREEKREERREEEGKEIGRGFSKSSPSLRVEENLRKTLPSKLSSFFPVFSP